MPLLRAINHLGKCPCPVLTAFGLVFVSGRPVAIIGPVECPVGGPPTGDDLSASWSGLRGWELGREMSVQDAEPIIA